MDIHDLRTETEVKQMLYFKATREQIDRLIEVLNERLPYKVSFWGEEGIYNTERVSPDIAATIIQCAAKLD